MVEGRVIPNGVDLTIFTPGSKREARASLGLSQTETILLFVANAARSNVFKDYRTVEQMAMRTAAGYRRGKITLLVVGEKGQPISFDNGEIRFLGYQREQKIMTKYYQAADVYVHAAMSDTFPNTVLEALACGLPVVATAIDGIPEQIDDGRSGFLVPPKDPETMSGRVIQLLVNDALRASMGTTAAEIAARSFAVQRQVQTYLDWYEQILAAHRMEGLMAHAC
jgi:glycosyltransferase involved in cell wall biosynthesis